MIKGMRVSSIPFSTGWDLRQCLCGPMCSTLPDKLQAPRVAGPDPNFIKHSGIELNAIKTLSSVQVPTFPHEPCFLGLWPSLMLLAGFSFNPLSQSTMPETRPKLS